MVDKIHAAIPKVTLGRSGIVSTKLGLGTASWPARVPYEDTVMMLQTALNAGIRHIDTAPLYQTEHIIGQALQELALPDDIVIATKAGSYSESSLGSQGQDYRADTIYRSVERSLKRLGIDHIHILHVHDVSPDRMPEVLAPDGALAALLDLKAQNVIGAIGMGTVFLSCLESAVQSGQFDIVQIFHTYTLLNQSAEENLFKLCREHKVSILNSAPFAGYILATGAGPGARYNYAPASSDVMAATHRLDEICNQKGVDLPTAAMAFSFRNDNIDVTIPASGKPIRISQWISAMHTPLSDEDFKEILAAAGGQYALPYAESS